MAATIKVAISIPKALFERAETLAQQIQVTRSRLFELALENYINSDPARASLGEATAARADLPGWAESQGVPGQPTGAAHTAINQGDIYWVPLPGPDGTEPGYTHPHVVVQDNVLNRSRIHTVVVCGLTSNVKRAGAPGNVRLEAGEANLPRPSVVVVSQVSTVDKTQLGEYIGALDPARIDQILAGMRFVQSFTERGE